MQKILLMPDEIPPVITVNGNNPETVTQGDNYSDAGATATDSTRQPGTQTRT